VCPVQVLHPTFLPSPGSPLPGGVSHTTSKGKKKKKRRKKTPNNKKNKKWRGQNYSLSSKSHEEMLLFSKGAYHLEKSQHVAANPWYREWQMLKQSRFKGYGECFAPLSASRCLEQGLWWLLPLCYR